MEKNNLKPQLHISNNQINIYNQCPYRYYLQYVKNLKKYEDNIFTVFGTAMHKTIQKYLQVMFNDSVKAADLLSLNNILFKQLTNLVQKEWSENKKKIVTVSELKDAFKDGVTILKFFKKKRRKYFNVREHKLLAIEQPLLVPLDENKNIMFKGFLDIVLQNKKTNKIKIIDLKTSYYGWKDKKKKDPCTRQQLIFYKKYYAKQFNIDINNIEVEYLILKRKVFSNYDWPVPRMQKFQPPSSKRTIKQYTTIINEMVENVFDKDGSYKDNIQLYPKQPSSYNCKYCSFKNTEYCNRKKKK